MPENEQPSNNPAPAKPASPAAAPQPDAGALAEQLGAVIGRQFNRLADSLHKEIELRFKGIEERLAASAEGPRPQPLPEDAQGRGTTLNDQAVSLFYRNELEQAMNLLEEASGLMPESVEIWNNLAMVYSGLGQAQKATLAFQKAADIDLARMEVLNNQAVLRLLQNNPQEALKILEEAKAANPQQVPILLNLAQAYLALGNYGRAIYTWRLVTAIDPKQEEATRHLKQYYQ